MPSSPVTDAAVALIELSAMTATASSPSNITTTTVSPTSSARVVPPLVSYQDIVSSLTGSTVEPQGIRTQPARRRGGRGRPPMPHLPAAAFRRPATLAQPGSQLTNLACRLLCLLIPTPGRSEFNIISTSPHWAATIVKIFYLIIL
jgi:hypothetical protein